jgi:hypothetical protein
MDKQPTLEELRQYFKSASLPPAPFELYQGTKILDMRKFIDSQFSVIDAGTSQAAIKPCYDRLVDLYKALGPTKQK